MLGIIMYALSPTLLTWASKLPLPPPCRPSGLTLEEAFLLPDPIEVGGGNLNFYI